MAKRKRVRRSPPSDELVAACETLWACYQALAIDDLSDNTFDRNEFYSFVLFLNRLAHRCPAPADVLAACRTLQEQTHGGDELAMQRTFESVMDATYARVGEG